MGEKRVANETPFITRDSKPFLLQKKINYHEKILIDVPSGGNKLISINFPQINKSEDKIKLSTFQVEVIC